MQVFIVATSNLSLAHWITKRNSFYLEVQAVVFLSFSLLSNLITLGSTLLSLAFFSQMSNSSVFVDFAVSTEMVVSQLALKLFISMPLLVSSSEFCCFSFWWLKFLCGFLFNSLNDLVMLEFRLIEKLLLSCNLLSCFFSSSCSSVGEFSVVGVEIGVVGAVQHNLCSQSPFLMTGVEFDAPMTRNLTHN